MSAIEQTCSRYGSSVGSALLTLQRHLPLGTAWDAYRLPGKRAYRLWDAISRAFDDATAGLCRLIQELNPYTTQWLLPEWERAVGLPDICLPPAETEAERRALVIFRLAKRRWTTAQDWKDLAALFGLEISITPGWHVQRKALFGDRTGGFDMFEFPLNFDLFPKLGRFRVYIDVAEIEFTGFEYGSAGTNEAVGFPIPFGGTDAALNRFACLIDRVRPANVIVIWNEFPETDNMVCHRLSFDPDLFESTFC